MKKALFVATLTALVAMTVLALASLVPLETIAVPTAEAQLAWTLPPCSNYWGNPCTQGVSPRRCMLAPGEPGISPSSLVATTRTRSSTTIPIDAFEGTATIPGILRPSRIRSQAYRVMVETS